MTPAPRANLWAHDGSHSLSPRLCPSGCPLAFGHRGTHMAMNLMLPEPASSVDTAVAIVFVAATIVAVTAWLRWDSTGPSWQ